MKSVLYLFRRRPGAQADETVDLALVSGVFEQRVSALFLDDGVYQLLALAHRQAKVKALPAYDVRSLYVAERSLAERRMAIGDIALPVQGADAGKVRELLATHDVVVPD